MAMKSAARAFLQQHGHTSLVSLGCGPELNRLDNHLLLLTALKLTYYVGVDCVPAITVQVPDCFHDRGKMVALLQNYYQGDPLRFRDLIKVFPSTWVEELGGVQGAVVICQRVWPGCRWERLIASMNPRLVLQEDLHGCERQQLREHGYVRTWLKIRTYGLEPFRPWRIFPGERNLILWRRKDFDGEEVQNSRGRLLWRFCERFIG
uniref:Uncharacterized protein n=1 Tax=Desulfobacca acetoxidans TaxID=60893 RepID=A0A7C3Z9H6_9BACT